MPVKSIVRLILRNKVVRIFLSATPGARELVILSRIWEHSFEPRWDHIVVDLPASGHTVALFRCPFLAQQTFDRGPLRKRAGEIAERFSDPEVTELLFCALPGEMPINETLETRAEIVKMGLPPVGGVLLNRFPDERFTQADESLLTALIETGEQDGVPPRVREVVEAAREVRREQGLADDGMKRLREDFGEKVESLPLLPGTHSQVADALSLMLAEGMR